MSRNRVWNTSGSGDAFIEKPRTVDGVDMFRFARKPVSALWFWTCGYCGSKLPSGKFQCPNCGAAREA